MELPYLNFRKHAKTMLNRYDTYAAYYNKNIERYNRENPSKKQQTLKSTHRSLFRELLAETGKEMLVQYNDYKRALKETGDATSVMALLPKIRTRRGIRCATNRVRLSKLTGKEITTVHRNIARLQEAGIITDKVNHGKYADFELYLHPDFLIISDHNQPETDPEEKSLFFPHMIAKCNVIIFKQEHLINKIYSANADNAVNFPEETRKEPANSNVGKIGDFISFSRTFSRTTDNRSNFSHTSTINQSEGTQENKKTGGGEKQYYGELKRFEQKLEQSQEREAWKNADTPQKKHVVSRMVFAAMVVDYLIEKIYTHRGVNIIPNARLKAIEYFENVYFPDPFDMKNASPFKSCNTTQDYVHRAEMLKWTIDAANRYAAKNKKFFVLINQYIDVKNANGLFRALSWYDNHKQRELDKQRHRQNMEDIRRLNDQIKRVITTPTPEMYERAERYIKTVIPKYMYVFKANVVSVLDKIQAENTAENQHRITG